MPVNQSEVQNCFLLRITGAIVCVIGRSNFKIMMKHIKIMFGTKLDGTGGNKLSDSAQ